MSPEVLFHAVAGSTGLVAGATALIARKGDPFHRIAGTVFFGAMLTTALSAVVLALLKDEQTNAIAGALTSYFITTSWLTVKRRERTAGLTEIVAMLAAAAGSVAAFYLAWDSVQKGAALLGGAPFYIFSAVTALCALISACSYGGGSRGRSALRVTFGACVWVSSSLSRRSFRGSCNSFRTTCAGSSR